MEAIPFEQEAVHVKSGPEYFVRFSLGQRIEHVLLMVTFTALSLTGLAQKFYTAAWAQWVILGMGGIGPTRIVHRAFAVVFIASIVYHLAYVTYAVVKGHSRPSMVPTPKDFRDVIAMLRYSFGLAPRPPQFGRFDYRQKFEYWGIIFGSAVIIASGLFLTYPVAVTQFFPGQFVAAAKEFHGNEAMLAVLTIVVWHLYDVVFKPDVFPGDLSIFTGRMTRERLRDEHALEYAELTGEAVGPETPAEPVPEAPADMEPPAGAAHTGTGPTSSPQATAPPRIP